MYTKSYLCMEVMFSPIINRETCEGGEISIPFWVIIWTVEISPYPLGDHMERWEILGRVGESNDVCGFPQQWYQSNGLGWLVQSRWCVQVIGSDKYWSLMSLVVDPCGIIVLKVFLIMWRSTGISCWLLLTTMYVCLYIFSCLTLVTLLNIIALAKTYSRKSGFMEEWGACLLIVASFFEHT